MTIRPGNSKPTDWRRGFTIVEMALAIGLIALSISIIAPMLVRIDRQRLAMQRNQYALLQLSNILDELTVTPPDLLEDTRQDLLPKAVYQMHQELPQAELTIVTEPLTEPAPGIQITCEVRWQNGSENWTRPVRLTGWNFLPSGITP